MDAEYFVIVAAFLLVMFLIGMAGLAVHVAGEIGQGEQHGKPSKDDAQSVRGAGNV